MGGFCYSVFYMENKSIVSTYAALVVVTVVGLMAVKWLNISYPLTITTQQRSAELSVVGEGKIEAVPDTVYIEVGVAVSNANTAQEAHREISRTNNQIIAALAKLGIAKANIKTSNYSVYPNYNYEGGQNTISGYSGSAGLTIKSNNPELASKITEVATSSGANEIRNTRFEMESPEKYRAQARAKAIENAKAQAKELADSLGIKLGRVTNIIESTPAGNGDMAMYSARAEGLGGGGAGPTFEPGTQTVTSVVTLFFEKK